MKSLFVLLDNVLSFKVKDFEPYFQILVFIVCSVGFSSSLNSRFDGFPYILAMFRLSFKVKVVVYFVPLKSRTASPSPVFFEHCPKGPNTSREGTQPLKPPQLTP